jgi:hypothetical protein
LGNEDREYELCDGTKPISCSIPSKHSKKSFAVHNKGNEKSTYCYATNQPSFFIEKQSTEPGSVLISEIIFNYGRLKFRQIISICKSFYSYILDVLFKEYDPKAKSIKTIRKR